MEVIFNIVFGIPLLVLWFGGWSVLTIYLLRFHTTLPLIASIIIGIFVGLAFDMFLLRFTASVPDYTAIPMTAEQRKISAIGQFLIYMPWGVTLLLVAFTYLRRRAR